MGEEQASSLVLFDESPASATPCARHRHVLICSADALLVRQLQRVLAACDVRTTVLAEVSAELVTEVVTEVGAAVSTFVDCDAVVIDLAVADAPLLLRRCAGGALLAVAGPGNAAFAQEEAIVCGAQLLVRPISQGALVAALARAFGEQRSRAVLAYHARRQSEHGVAQLIGESTPMLRLRAGLRLLLDRQRHAAHASPHFVLLHGERGTGKSRTARALHGDGPRAGGVLLRFDARGLSSAEVEERLFGKRRLGLDGVRDADPGLIAAAEGGTLYIREIADIALPLQARLADGVDTHLIFGSRRAPEQLIAADALSPRLWAARLSQSTLAMPPLRKRGGDACVIARTMMTALAEQRGLPRPTWDRTVADVLLRHSWPGNVRELRHAMERALLVQRNGVIDGASLRLELPQAAQASAPAADLELGRIEQAALTTALERARGNVSKAARLLGITRDTLRYRMNKQGLARSAGHAAPESTLVSPLEGRC